MTQSITRRDFMKAGGAVLAGAALSAGAVAMPLRKRRIRSAIAYASIGYQGTVLEKLKAVKAAGFEGVELMSHMFAPDVIAALEESDLEPVGVCCATEPDEFTSRGAVEPTSTRLFQALKDAGQYGGVPVRLALGGLTNGVTYDDRLKQSVELIQWIAPMAENQGAKLAVEIAGNGFITKPDQARDFLNTVKSSQVGWHFNPTAAARHATLDAWVSALGKNILNLQVTERGKTKGADVRLSEGTTDWPAVLRALASVDFQGWAICEQPISQSATAKSLKDLAQRMDRIFAG